MLELGRGGNSKYFHKRPEIPFGLFDESGRKNDLWVCWFDRVENGKKVILQYKFKERRGILSLFLTAVKKK